MIQKIKFKKKEELLAKIPFDYGCKDGYDWVMSQPDLYTIFKTCPLEMRIWAIMRGYIQFEEDCNWEELNDQAWFFIMIHRFDLKNKFIEYKAWEKFSCDSEWKEKMLNRNNELKIYFSNE